MNIMDKDVQKLADAVTLTDDAKRLAAYSGVAAAYVELNNIKPADGTSVLSNDSKMSMYDFVYKLNEVTIIDKDMLKAVMVKFASFKLNPMERSPVMNSFNDVIGVNKYFGEGLVKAVNDNMFDFNSSYLSCIAVINKEKNNTRMLDVNR